jgi:hypothetical protein
MHLRGIRYRTRQTNRQLRAQRLQLVQIARQHVFWIALMPNARDMRVEVPPARRLQLHQLLRKLPDLHVVRRHDGWVGAAAGRFRLA